MSSLGRVLLASIWYEAQKSVDACTCFQALSTSGTFLLGHRHVCYLFARRYVGALPVSTPTMFQRLSPCVVSSSIAFLSNPWLLSPTADTVR